MVKHMTEANPMPSAIVRWTMYSSFSSLGISITSKYLLLSRPSASSSWAMYVWMMAVAPEMRASANTMIDTMENFENCCGALGGGSSFFSSFFFSSSFFSSFFSSLGGSSFFSSFFFFLLFLFFGRFGRLVLDDYHVWLPLLLILLLLIIMRTSIGRRRRGIRWIRRIHGLRWRRRGHHGHGIGNPHHGLHLHLHLRRWWRRRRGRSAM
mmetsp:Transcript_2670/g.4764  ORF Transcript_2670/g.4764 Transcript_2670/m.4764 type:complete len:209 (+) Transcript_2670:339-965(+)